MKSPKRREIISLVFSCLCITKSLLIRISLVLSEVAEIALFAVRLGQFQELLKTRVILILIFTWPHAITYSNYFTKHFFSLSWENLTEK